MGKILIANYFTHENDTPFFTLLQGKFHKR